MRTKFHPEARGSSGATTVQITGIERRMIQVDPQGCRDVDRRLLRQGRAGLARAWDWPTGYENGSITEVEMKHAKVQSLRSLREELKAVARGEKPAPADASKPSFNSVEAVVRLL